MAIPLHCRPSRPPSLLHSFCRLPSLRPSKRICLLRILFAFLLACFLISLRYSLLYTVTLDVPALCAANLKLHSHSHSHRRSNATSPRFSILTLLDRSSLSAMAARYPALLESRSLYAGLHGYALRTYFHRLDPQRPLVWSKLLAIHDIFYSDAAQEVLDIFPYSKTPSSAEAATEEWVWALDLDALIFNFSVELQEIVGRQDADIVIASDHNGLNAGSFLIRKSEWTRRFLSRWWVRGDDMAVPRIGKLFEQAVLAELVKADQSVAAHVHVAAIRDFNAYGYPASELYLFQAGDFVVHCPGPTLKKWLPAYAREWERMMRECRLPELWLDAGVRLETEARHFAGSNL